MECLAQRVPPDIGIAMAGVFLDIRRVVAPVMPGAA
jgi:hypothetical protein